jgi:hypothetical protein
MLAEIDGSWPAAARSLEIIRDLRAGLQQA